MRPDGLDDLIRMAQGGDQQAMERVLELLRPHLAVLARQYADPERAAESVSDLVQEAELRAWRGLAEFKGGKNDAETFATLHAWLTRIVSRLGRDARRDRAAWKRRPRGAAVVSLDAAPPGSASERRHDPPGKESTPSARLRSSEEARAVQAAIEKLPREVDREIVRLYFFDELSLSEIAARLHLGHDLVKKHYRASMKRLERELGGVP